ncbi:MAG: hypothetical protein K0U72_03090 [Gammaproteobacteria bacterium]|nr:hypothetical protein [Gammaproteobacteria bacterium]
MTNDAVPPEGKDVRTVGDQTLGELLDSMGGVDTRVPPIFECVEATSDIDVRDGYDYTDEEYDEALPKINGLSDEGRKCAEEYKAHYAEQVYDACLAADCGANHPRGCDVIVPYLINMGVIFDAGLACVDEN